jgi:hypothetical protein
MAVLGNVVPAKAANGGADKPEPEVEVLPGGAKVFRSHGRRPVVFRASGNDVVGDAPAAVVAPCREPA